MINRPDTRSQRIKRHKRVRAKISGTPERPRLNVFRSNTNIYAQVIDDVTGKTLVSASSLEKGFEGKGSDCEAAKKVGLAVAERAKAAGIDAVTVKLPMAYAGRYVAENEGPVGIAKFVFDKKYRTLVGAHVMSNYSSEFILACAVMIEKEMTVDAIREIVYPHPSVSEIIREAAFAVKL